MSDEAAFLETLKTNPTDDTTRLVYADWLDEHNEPRKAEYLRFVVSLTQHNCDLANAYNYEKLVNAGKGLSPTWRVATSKRFSLMLRSCDDKFRAFILIRKMTGYGLREAKKASENLPYLFMYSVTFECAWAAVKSVTRVSEFDLLIVPTEDAPPITSAD